MTRDELIDQYFDWVYQLVVDDRYSNKSYRKLFARLYDTEFTYTIPMDGNRAEDGIDLRSVSYTHLDVYKRQVYNHCTLFLVGERGLAVIQQRYDPETKHTFWAEVDEWLTDPLYLHPRFRAFFDRRAGTGTDRKSTRLNSSHRL